MKCYSDVEIQSVNGPEDDGPKDTPHEPQDQEDFLDEEPLEEADLDDTPSWREDAQDEDALEEVEAGRGRRLKNGPMSQNDVKKLDKPKTLVL